MQPRPQDPAGGCAVRGRKRASAIAMCRLLSGLGVDMVRVAVERPQA